MLGMICWFSAEVVLMYYYYAYGIENQKLVSVPDAFWFAGYVFLALHLFAVLRSLRRKINIGIIVLASAASILFVVYNTSNLLSSEFLNNTDFAAFVVTIAYPILDLALILPSAIILLSLHKDYEHSIPWVLSSLSLLVNAIADDGYVNDFVIDNSHNLWVWDLFYVADFIIMSGALFWYNKFHISTETRSNARIKG
jgi:hypothetical protein